MSKILNDEELWYYLEKLYNNQEDIFYSETLDILENIFEHEEKFSK